MKRRVLQGFTIVELLVVISIIALLVGILLPAIGKARDSARLRQSSSNLRQLALAHNMYASEWNDRQYQLSRDDFGAYGNNLSSYMAYSPANNYWIPLGWANGFQWVFVQSPRFHEPIVFSGPGAGFGYFRVPNMPPMTQYLGGRMYDPVFWAPKDRVLLEESGVEECFEHPGELCLPEGGQPFYVPTTYCLSPAALFSPDVFSPPRVGIYNDPINSSYGLGWQNPWSLAGGFRTPTMSQARYPDLKTHMLEHTWLQNPPTECNPNFLANSVFTDCEPYYFNHGVESRPVTLFYDGHVSVIGTEQARRSSFQHLVQVGFGLWSQDTPLGSAPNGGYFMGDGYDNIATSFHILTTHGILGRDIAGGGF